MCIILNNLVVLFYFGTGPPSLIPTRSIGCWCIGPINPEHFVHRSKSAHVSHLCQ